MGGKLGLQRLQPPAGTADPSRQGRAFDPGAMPGEDLSLPVERGVVAVFADQHLGKESWGRHPLGDRALRGRGLMDRVTGAATIFGTADADHPELGRDPVECNSYDLI